MHGICLGETLALGDMSIAALFTISKPISNPNPHQQERLKLSGDIINRMLYRGKNKLKQNTLP